MEAVWQESSAQESFHVKNGVPNQTKGGIQISGNGKSNHGDVNYLNRQISTTPVDIQFENVTFTATYRSQHGNLPSFLGKQGKTMQ